MKRTVSLILTAAMLFLLIPFSVSAESVTDEQGVTYTLSDDGTYYIVSSFDRSVAEVVIPSEIDGIPVTSIGKYAFPGSTGLTSIAIPDSITSVGMYAFDGCTGLTAVYITDIAAWCGIDFSSNPLAYAGKLYLNDTLITDLVIPDSVTSIGNAAFAGCTGLTSITIHDGVTSIGDSAFAGCTGITSITIPYGVTSIGYNTFRGCSNLTSIVIPDSVTSIGYGAFYLCESLTSINIPDSVTSIGERAFYGCDSLTDIYCETESQSESWDEYWLDGCNATVHWGDSDEPFDEDLDGDGIPDRYGPTLDEDGNCTFENAYGFVFDINYVNGTIAGEDTTLITNANAYESCNPNWAVSVLLKETENAGVYSVIRLVDLPVTAANAGIDWNESDLVLVVHSATTNPYMEEYYPSWMSRVAALALEQGDMIAISDDMTTATVNYPDDDDDTSDDTSDDVSAIVPEEAYTDEQGVTYTLSDDGTYYIVDDFDGSVTEVDIPAEIYGLLVTVIGNHAFSDCYGLTSVTIPDSVTSIGDYAFTYCLRLTSVTLPNRITTIGEGVFHSCADLIRINIPDSVTSIGERAFYSCESLTSVTLGDNITSIGREAFYWCLGLTDIYCEAESQPKGWDAKWLDRCNATVHWGYDPAQDVKEELSTAIDAAEALLENELPPEHWADLDTALNFAKSYDTTDKSIEDIQSVTEVLNEIIEGKPLVKGDADRSGKVDQFDYLMVKRGYFDTYTLYSGDMLRADIDTSASIDQFDYLCIKRAYFGTYVIE